MKGEVRKEYYWQLRRFEQCDPDRFKEMSIPQKQWIYLFKKDIPQVVIRIQDPIQKIHCWTFREIQICERLNDNPKVFHWRHVYIPFRGQLILSILQNFNRCLRDEIQSAIPRKTKALQHWMNSNLDDVFFISQKNQKSFGFEHAFMEIKTLYRTRFKNYYEMSGWKAQSWEGLLEIAKDQRMESNSSYGVQLNQIDKFIGNFEVINNQHFEDMFELHPTKKPAKERPKDKFQLEYERKILLNYGLYEYIQK